MWHQSMCMRKKLLFRHSGKTRERREDHRSQEKSLQVSKYWNERRKDHRDLSQKENCKFLKNQTNLRNAIYQCVQTHSFMRK